MTSPDGNDDGDGDGDDVLDIGADPPAWILHLREVARRRRRPLVAVGALVLALLAAAAVVLAARPPAPLTGAGTAAAAATASTPRVSRVPGPIQTVLALARRPLADYVRQTSAAGACAPVRVGASPSGAIAAVIARAQPGYVVQSVGRTLDQFTGLCSIQVRATRARDVLLLSVSAPPAGGARAVPKLETGILGDGGLVTKYALAVTDRGWTVLVGATGRSDALPSAAELLDMAQAPTLLW